MTDALRRAYAVLGLEPDASAGMLREQYLLLVKRWHPDRYGTDPVNQAYAAERMREINEAYQLIVSDQRAEGAAAASADTPEEPEPRGNAGWGSSRNQQVIDSILRNQHPGSSFRLSTSRTLSLTVSALYALWAVFSREPRALAGVVGLLVLPLACIWFPDALGGYVGGLAARRITHASPGSAVAIAGWSLLLLPVLVAIVMMLRGA